MASNELSNLSETQLRQIAKDNFDVSNTQGMSRTQLEEQIQSQDNWQQVVKEYTQSQKGQQGTV